MEDYEISSATLAIVPLGEEVSKVYEEEDEYIIQKSANSIIKDNAPTKALNINLINFLCLFKVISTVIINNKS